MSTQTSRMQTRIANESDAEGLTALINLAFRGAENFFVEADRVDLEGVLGLLATGEFLLVETEGALVGCVYLEPRGDRT